MHANGIIHRDLSLDTVRVKNISDDDRLCVKIDNFDLSFQLKKDHLVT